jgi:drug/metabolite transporter (DMT)-like permease
MTTGVLAAIAAAMLYNLAVVVQKTQAQQVETSGVRIIGALAKRRIWLLGVALQLVGFAMHYLALTRAPVTVVQPIIAAGIAFVVIFAALLLGERPGSREIGGMLMTATGVGLLLLRLEPAAAMRPVAAHDLGIALGATAVLIAVLLRMASARGIRGDGVRAALAGSAAGVGFGMSDAMNRLMGSWLSPPGGWVPPDAIGIAAAFFLFAFGFQGFVTAQNAFRLYRANTVVPCIRAAQLLVPIAMAIALYGQSLPAGAADRALWGAALALTLMGVIRLSSSPQVAASFGEAG